MASVKDLVMGQLQTGMMLIEKAIEDLADEEYFKPAAPGTNHIGWILGHLAQSEDSMVAVITEKKARLGEEYREKYSGGSACVADSANYPSGKELTELFRNHRAHTIEALTAFDESQWDDPTPEGLPRDFFPTKGIVWGMMGTHPFWHIGQMTTCRSAMGKKALLG